MTKDQAIAFVITHWVLPELPYVTFTLENAVEMQQVLLILGYKVDVHSSVRDAQRFYLQITELQRTHNDPC